MVLCTRVSRLLGGLRRQGVEKFDMLKFQNEDHATTFKARLIQKLFNISINYKNTYSLYMFEHFSYPKIFGSTPRCPKHRGVILNAKKQKKEKWPKDISNGTRRSCLVEKSGYKKSRETVPLRDHFRTD